MNNSLACIDANIVIPALIPHPLSNKAEARLRQWQQDEVSLVAPALLAFEVTSVIRGFVFHEIISSERGEQAVAEFLGMPIRFSSQRAIFPMSFQLAQELNRPKAYDTAYLALAQLRDCEFWTADKKLYNAVKDELAWVQWLGDYSPGGNGK